MFRSANVTLHQGSKAPTYINGTGFWRGIENHKPTGGFAGRSIDHKNRLPHTVFKEHTMNERWTAISRLEARWLIKREPWLAVAVVDRLPAVPIHCPCNSTTPPLTPSGADAFWKFLPRIRVHSRAVHTRIHPCERGLMVYNEVKTVQLFVTVPWTQIPCGKFIPKGFLRY